MGKNARDTPLCYYELRCGSHLGDKGAHGQKQAGFWGSVLCLCRLSGHWMLRHGLSVVGGRPCESFWGHDQLLGGHSVTECFRVVFATLPVLSPLSFLSTLPSFVSLGPPCLLSSATSSYPSFVELISIIAPVQEQIPQGTSPPTYLSPGQPCPTMVGMCSFVPSSGQCALPSHPALYRELALLRKGNRATMTSFYFI